MVWMRAMVRAQDERSFEYGGDHGSIYLYEIGHGRRSLER